MNKPYHWFRWKQCGDLPQYESWTKWHLTYEMGWRGATTECGIRAQARPEWCFQKKDHEDDDPPLDKRCKRCARAYGLEVTDADDR